MRERMETGNKRVGVFMQLYRNEPSMHKAIQSVLEQTYTNFKYYVLVSAATKHAVMEYAKKDTRIEVLDGKPGESSYNYDKYIAGDGNAYFTVIDADDWYERNYIETLIDYLEKYQMDIVACGNYFVNMEEKRIGTRQQREMIWNTEDTLQVLPYMYAFFRTIWGKMIRSEIILEYNLEGLPISSSYGGYGGDTLFMFYLFPLTKKVGICSEVLYNYRMSSTSGSYVLKEGRLDADTIVFQFVKNILNKIGTVGEREERFLYLIYGEALKDTTKLLLGQKIREEERSKKLLYIYQCELTRTLLERQRKGLLELPDMPPIEVHEVTFYQMLFSNPSRITATKKTAEDYLKLLEILYPRLNGLLSVEEFMILLKKGGLLEQLCLERYQVLFTELLDLLKEVKLKDAEICLQLLRRVTFNVILRPFLQEKKFVLCYADIITAVHREEWGKAFQLLQESFVGNIMPYEPEQLADLWINLAAFLESEEAFILGKELKTELLLNTGKKEEAIQEYEDLKQLGVEDENMKYLSACLYGSLGKGEKDNGECC